MSTDTAARLEYLAASVDLLWPDAADRRLVVLPARRAPRVLVPTTPARAAAAALLRYTAQQGRVDRLAALGLAVAARAGLTRFAARVEPRIGIEPGESVDDLLGRVMGEPVVSSLAVTRPRPNRKPVLQVFDRRGRTIAFAKVGVTPLAADLVRHEATALAELATADLEHLETPGVLYAGAWRGTFVLVSTCLPTGRAVPAHDERLIAAMVELSRAGGISGDYLTGLRERAAAVDTGNGAWPALVADAAVAARGIPLGAWHGDWTSWNCARRAGRLFVWDWERFTHPVPQGMDRLHFAVNEAVGPGNRKFGPAVHQVVRDAPVLLQPWGLDADSARRVASLYCLDLALRYLADGPGDRERIERWALPTITNGLGRGGAQQ